MNQTADKPIQYANSVVDRETVKHDQTHQFMWVKALPSLTGLARRRSVEDRNEFEQATLLRIDRWRR